MLHDAITLAAVLASLAFIGRRISRRSHPGDALAHAERLGTVERHPAARQRQVIYGVPSCWPDGEIGSEELKVFLEIARTYHAGETQPQERKQQS